MYLKLPSGKIPDHYRFIMARRARGAVIANQIENPPESLAKNLAENPSENPLENLTEIYYRNLLQKSTGKLHNVMTPFQKKLQFARI